MSTEISLPPSDNKLNIFKNAMADLKERKLSIEREYTLVNHLACLAAITNDVLKVMAVAVEEFAARLSITIRLLVTTHGGLEQVWDQFC